MAEPVQDASVLSIRDLSPAIRQLILLPRERPLHFAPGQWVSVKLPVGSRPPLVRAYSMAEPESATGELVLVLDRVPGGLGSNYLFTLKDGATVSISGPHGNFRLPEDSEKELLFLARFTGIVPIRCMIVDLITRRDRAGPLPTMTLVYAGPARDLIYDAEFRQLDEAEPRFRYVPLVFDEAHEPETSSIERIERTVRALLGDRPAVYPMLAGTKSFVRPLRTLLGEMGFERRAMKHETYD